MTGLYDIYCGSELPPLTGTEITLSNLTLELQLTQREVGAGFKAIYTIVGKPNRFYRLYVNFVRLAVLINKRTTDGYIQNT